MAGRVTSLGPGVWKRGPRERQNLPRGQVREPSGTKGSGPRNRPRELLHVLVNV